MNKTAPTDLFEWADHARPSAEIIEFLPHLMKAWKRPDWNDLPHIDNQASVLRLKRA